MGVSGPSFGRVGTFATKVSVARATTESGLGADRSMPTILPAMHTPDDLRHDVAGVWWPSDGAETGDLGFLCFVGRKYPCCAVPFTVVENGSLSAVKLDASGTGRAAH
jgi:hypothetical protein